MHGSSPGRIWVCFASFTNSLGHDCCCVGLVCAGRQPQRQPRASSWWCMAVGLALAQSLPKPRQLWAAPLWCQLQQAARWDWMRYCSVSPVGADMGPFVVAACQRGPSGVESLHNLWMHGHYARSSLSAALCLPGAAEGVHSLGGHRAAPAQQVATTSVARTLAHVPRHLWPLGVCDTMRCSSARFCAVHATLLHFWAGLVIICHMHATHVLTQTMSLP